MRKLLSANFSRLWRSKIFWVLEALSAIAGAVGGGGLGDVAIRYGYSRYETSVMIVTVVLLVGLVQILQVIGTRLSKKLDRRIV